MNRCKTVKFSYLQYYPYRLSFTWTKGQFKVLLYFMIYLLEFAARYKKVIYHFRKCPQNNLFFFLQCYYITVMFFFFIVGEYIRHLITLYWLFNRFHQFSACIAYENFVFNNPYLSLFWNSACQSHIKDDKSLNEEICHACGKILQL
jgi:hypothetical protein